MDKIDKRSKKESREPLLCYGSAILITLICIMFSPQDVSKLGGWTFIPLLYLLIYALTFKRVIEGLFLSTIIAYTLMYKGNFFNPLIDGLYTELGNASLHFLILLTALFNVFISLIQKAGVLDAFVVFILKRCKTEKSIKVTTWLLAWPIFVDDYLSIMTLGSVLTPVYDKKRVPREELAFIVHSLAGTIRIIFPITSWAAVLGGVFESGGLTVNGSGLSAFFVTIPFNFYAWVAIIGALLFALGIMPKIGKMKNCVPAELEENEVDTTILNTRANLFDFFIPLAVVVIATFYFDYNVVTALFVMLPLTFTYYLIRGFIKPADVEGALIDGFIETMPMIIMFTVAYMFSTALSSIGFINLVIEAGQHFLSPSLLPVFIFVLFCFTETPMSLAWAFIIVAFPVVIPLAQSIGANPYLTASAMLSAIVFGSHICFVADYTILTASSTKVDQYQHAITNLPYPIIYAIITAGLYLIAGFVF